MSLSDLRCAEFVSRLGSGDPVPGGGGASALVGALGIALGNMVAALTLGKKKYAALEEELLRLRAAAEGLQADLLALVQRDAEVFEPLARAYGMPRATEAERAEKDRVMEGALRAASAVPLEILEKCGEAMGLLGEFAAKGNPLALSDAGAGAAFCGAALAGASLNVFINTAAMKDRVYAEELNRKAEALAAEYGGMADRIFTAVKEGLRRSWP